MDKEYIHILMNLFFHGEFSTETQKKFQAWLLDEKYQKEKEEAMYVLWQKEINCAQSSAYSDLIKIDKSIDASVQKRHKPIGLYIRQIAAIILLPLLGVLGSYFYQIYKNQKIEDIDLQECFVPNGERKQINLPDGTTIWLNSGSLLVYDPTFKGNKRTLFLNGEARFQVAKNPQKPFIVKTAHMAVTALGTEFNLNAYSNQKEVIATLNEGKIKVKPYSSQDTSFILSPDEQIIYNHQTEILVRNSINAQRTLQWTDGYLIFQSASFDQIATALERKFNVSINYEAEHFTGRTFTMKFTPDENIEQVLNIIKETIKGFHYKIKNDKIYINQK